MACTDEISGKGNAVLVTGAARGIGAATARRFTMEGARVLVTDVDPAEAEKTAAAIGSAEPFVCDVGSRESVESAVAYAVDVFGSLDVLVNNACACHPDAPLFEDEPDEVWARDLDITLTGAFRCCRAALPHLAASGRGAIVNVGSVNGLMDFGNHAYTFRSVPGQLQLPQEPISVLHSTTVRSSSTTVQYLVPDGIRTGNART